MRWLVLVALLAAMIGCGSPRESTVGSGPSPRSTVEEASLPPVFRRVFRCADEGVTSLAPPHGGFTVLFVYSTECPIANFFVPVMNGLFSKHGDERIRWVGACVDPGLSLEALRRHAEEYAVGFAVMLDESGRLAREFGATTTPEVIVFDSRGRVAYQGRIDDQYAARGKKTSAPRSQDLDDALTALLAGKPVAQPRTEAVGCPLPEMAAPAESAEPRITYSEHLAPLIDRHCVNCHREGSAAPFPLETFAQAAKRAGDLATVTQSRFMPPRSLDATFGRRFAHEHSLADAEIELFAAWAKQGAIQGDATLRPPLPPIHDGWQFGEPDVVLEMTEPFEVPATGPDIYRCFVIPTDFAEDMWVTAAEYRPSSPQAVHHLIAHVSDTGEARVLDAEDPEPGYEAFGGPRVTVSGDLAGAGVGWWGERLPPGVARKLPRGADVLVHMHYHPTGKPCTDRTRIGLHFSRESVPRRFFTMPVSNYRFFIPAGDSNREIDVVRRVPFDLVAYTLYPHMHMLAKDMTVWMEKPSGERVDLIRVSPWDSNWQRGYRLDRPLFIPEGSIVYVKAHYDNSSENPANPHRDKPIDVVFGQSSTDEMCVCTFGVTLAPPGDRELDEAEVYAALMTPETPNVLGFHAAPEAGGASLERTKDGYRLHMPPVATTLKPGSVQVMQYASVEKQEHFRMDIRLKADKPRTVRWGVRQSHRPYEKLAAGGTLRLTTAWQDFRIEFVAERDEPRAKIVISAGGEAGVIEFGEPSLTTSAASVSSREKGLAR